MTSHPQGPDEILNDYNFILLNEITSFAVCFLSTVKVLEHNIYAFLKKHGMLQNRAIKTQGYQNNRVRYTTPQNFIMTLKKKKKKDRNLIFKW